ncbi:cobyrinate a,c-diamide synthase [Paenibacillus sp. J2TS4]|uniref:cobyrinate a,c-diamide synthase n=1 Tax=Paenibacillus sp. J2TS4 TaxID=2807194 RepID=UPI001BCC3AE1|nr:cobyrinate a,c-diamide synthase [Paenibacillus sp. J2TS4]
MKTDLKTVQPSDHRLVIAGTGSGSGKTTATLAIMAALRRRGYKVQGFKCGPDYIDPSYHTAITGRVSRNLDSWMLTPDGVKEVYVRGSQEADINLIEGVMGFYDGKDPTSNAGSTAEISQLLACPVVLVVDCAGMARSAAAIVQGFQRFSDDIRIAGVIAGRIGSEGHYRLIQAAIEQECGIPALGWLRRDDAVALPERHLGLIPALARGELEPLFERLADLAEAGLELDQLLALAKSPPVRAERTMFPPAPAPASSCPPLNLGSPPPSDPPAAPLAGSRGFTRSISGTSQEEEPRLRIAIAKDAAFHFYYPENIELLEAYGAECVYFSPLRGELIPEGASGLYIGGGFPEEFASVLSAQEETKASIREGIRSGMPALAECGGFMYLTDEIRTRDGQSYPMVGLIPGFTEMKDRLQALGYREIRGTERNFLLGEEETARGHQFHYSVFTPAGEGAHAYWTKGRKGEQAEGYQEGNLVAGYSHIHFGSNPQLVVRWLNRCREYRQASR